MNNNIKIRKRKRQFTPTVSKLEDVFAEKFLDPLKVVYERQKRIGMFIYDFFVPEYNLLIEVNGAYYHSDPRVYKSEDLNSMQRKNKIRDEHKEQCARHFGFRLLVVWEGDILYNSQMVQELLDSEFT